MKRIIILLLMTAIPASALAQETNFAAFFKKYQAKEGFTTVEISGEMLKLLDGFSSDKPKSGKGSPADGIDFIKIVVAENPTDTFVKELKRLPEDDFKLMSSITDGGQNISFFFREKPDKKKKQEFLMIIYGKEDNLALSITGDIDIKKISGLTGINIKGMDKLNGMDKDK